MNPKIYLSIARDDLNASRILLKNNCFPQALFFTEQSVEKICKYIIFKDNIIDENKLKKKVRHNSMIVFDLMANYMIDRLSSTNSLSDPNINKLHKQLIEDSAYLIKLRNDSKIKELDEETIDEYDFKLHIYTKLNLDLNSEFSFYLKLSPEEFIEVLKKTNILDEESAKNLEIKFQNPEEKKYYIDLVKNILEVLPKYQNLVMASLTLATIFSNHSESTRYPFGDENLKPIDLYNNDTILIKRLNDFHDYIDITINGFETINI